MPTSSRTSEALLDATGVQKSFGSVAALRDASLRVRPGSIHALMGGNGSGKSTLAKTILGVVRPDAGRIVVDSATVSGGPESSRAAGVFGTFQETALAGDLTVAENILIDRLPRRWGLVSDSRRSARMLAQDVERVGLAPSMLHRKVRELALDERCLVELARVLRHRPKILILDELTASLRREQVLRVGEILRDVAAAGSSVLFVSHRLEEITELCDSATVLRNGSTVLHAENLRDHTMDELLASMTGENAEEGASSRRTVARSADGSAGRPLLEVIDVDVPGFGATATLTARAGEIVGIAGLSDNGQSELLKCLFGSFGAVGGTCSVDGRRVVVRHVRDAVRCGIGYVSGEREREMAFGQRSIAENLGVVAMTLKKAVDANPLMSRMKLVSHGRAPMRALSGGNQQKVILGRWLALEPTVMLADDPTRGVDVSTRNEIHALLRELVAKGDSCVVVSSSDDHELAELCDRVYVMHAGRIAAELVGDDVDERRIGVASLTSHRSAETAVLEQEAVS